MSNTTEREALAADIKAAIAELADGKVFPDLIAAIDRLAAQPSAPVEAPSEQQAGEAVLPPMPMTCYKRADGAPLFDTFHMHAYALRYADAAIAARKEGA